MPGVGESPFGPGGSPFGFGASSVSEGQLTSGLIELTIYGIVSLYEKYEPAPDVQAGQGGTPPANTPPTNNPAAPTTNPASKE